MRKAKSIQAFPVVDLFAGPGGLGEGFSAFESGGRRPFDVRLSIEKDAVACATLRLRKFFRQFDGPPPEYGTYCSGALTRTELFEAYPAEAQRADQGTWEAELGKVDADMVRRRVGQHLGASRNWVLLGGPPCQAYSIAGRARMKSTRPDFDKDERHFLYREYLRIVADHQPAIFVLENVKGLLTSRQGGRKILSTIIKDLGQPGVELGIKGAESLRYRLYELGRTESVLPWMTDGPIDDDEFLLHAEDYGIPQMRHRIFIVGIRSDVPGRPDGLAKRPPVPVSSVLADLPRIRSMLSREPDSLESWRDAVSDAARQEWLGAALRSPLGTVARAARDVLKEIRSAKFDPGGVTLKYTQAPAAYDDWYRRHSAGLTHHESRAHMREDLHRYLFCACFGRIHKQSPKLRDFPKQLYPSHENVSKAINGNMFDDRFRVQLADRPATTITSHISKDGHYYIHYDPVQCRSLTVREAARLQTFPDSYFFEGNRTEQYHQIGNAVPPLLARDIAGVVFDVLNHSKPE